MSDGEVKSLIENDADLEAFRKALDVPAERFSLFQAALLISAMEYPGRRESWWRRWHRHLNELISDARQAIEEPPALTRKVALRRLCYFFCDTMDFQGDTEEYSSARNSCLKDVLERRRGLPITLSVLLISIGSRLGFDLFGVSAPGHFLVGARLPGEDEPYFIDPFHGQDLLTRDEAAERVASQMSLESDQVLPFLVRAEPRQILLRMLNNLKMTYRQAGDMRKLLRVVNWLLVVQPNNMSEIRNRGLLLLRLGETEAGARDLLQYVADCPDAEDLDVIRGEALRALKDRSRWN